MKAILALTALGACSAFVVGIAIAQSGDADSASSETSMPQLPRGVADADDLPDAARTAYEDALLESARPAPDTDGDPTTIEGVLPDGRPVGVVVQTSKPEAYEGVDIDEFASGRSPW
jgi:hypothetical protein